MQNYTLKDYYKRIRENGATASRALQLARDNLAAARKLYDIPTCANIEYNREGESGARWIESASQGLRLVGYCDDIATRIRHRGWFTDDDGEVLRGVVYSLPHARYIAGYADPFNDDCALLDFRHVYTDKITAAYAADKIAESHAEKEREYREAYRAGVMYQDNLNTVKSERVQLIGLLAAMRIERKRGAAAVICDALRAQVRVHISTIKQAREAARKLYISNNEAFNEGVRSC